MKTNRLKKIAVTTLGCKVNKYDSAVICEIIKRAGCSLVQVDQKADVYIVNTCTVTRRADYQSRRLIRRAHRLNPSAQIIVTGCYAQRASQKIEEIPGVDYIVGVGELERIADLIISPSKRDIPLVISGDIREKKEVGAYEISHFPKYTRAFLKVQDGCNSFCSYCVIPYSRGGSRSLRQKETIKSISKLADAGHREIVLTGIHLGSYGWDQTPSTTLANLIRSIEDNGFSGRIRLSSIEPAEFSDDLIEIISSSSLVCNHLHIPLQSGDDEILTKMRRPYKSLFFRKLVQRLVSTIPDVNIGIDVIVGFPGETEDNFNNTLRLITDLPVGYLHVFPYSRRPGTPAADFPDQVDGKTARKRAQILRDLGNRKREEFYKSFVGRRQLILIESKRDKDTNYQKGFSRNYIPVLVDTDEDVMNKEISIVITGIQDGKVFGMVFQKQGDE